MLSRPACDRRLRERGAVRGLIPPKRPGGRAGSRGSASVEEPIDQAVGAKQEQISRLRTPRLRPAGSQIGGRLPSARCSALRPRMLARLPFGDLGVAEEPTDVSIVMADLFDSSFQLRQIVDPAVSDMGEIHPARGKPAHAQGRAHAGAIRHRCNRDTSGLCGFR